MLASLLVVGATPDTAQAAPECPGGGSCLRVHLVDNGRETEVRYVSNAELRGPFRDLGTTRYRTRTEAGEEPQPEPTFLGAVSIRSLIRGVQVNLDNVTYVQIRNPADSRGYVSRLTRNEIGPNGFENGLEPAFEATTTDTVNYARPLRAGDDSDVNNEDILLTTKGDLLDVVIGIGGEQVDPRISATPTQATVGEPVRFTSTVDRPGAYSYSWDFGERGTATEPNPQHVFATTGTYVVSLALSGDAYGQSNLLRIRVGQADDPADDPGGGAGGGGGGGGTGGAGGGGGGGGSGGEAGEDAGEQPGGQGTSDDPNAPATGPDAGSSGQTGGGAPGPRVTDPGQGGQATQPREPTQPKQTDKPGKRRTPAPGEVTGVLLAGGATVVPLGEAQLETPTAGQEATAPTARAASVGGGGAGLWWGAGLLPLLLLVGAAGETGALAAVRARLRRRA